MAKVGTFFPRMLSTPQRFIKRVQDEDVQTPRSEIATLRSLLKDAQTTIEDKQKDLILAAEIGQNLVDENTKLKIEYEKILFKSSGQIERSQQNVDIMYRDLEVSYTNIISQHETLQKEFNLLEEMDKSHRNTINRLEQEQLRMQDEMVKRLDDVQRLEDDKSKLLKENFSLAKLNDELQNSRQGGEGKVACLLKDLHQLQTAFENVKNDLQNTKEDLRIVISRKNELEEKCEELQELMETYYSYRDTVQMQSDDIIQLTGELEFLRESNTRLKNRLSVLEPTKDSEGQDQGSKTLLGEVEDRRQELESANIALSEKHAGLVKIHQFSLCQNGKMQNHLTRLKQLTMSESSRQKTKMLELALSQCQSEKKELEEQITNLQHQQENGIKNANSVEIDYHHTIGRKDNSDLELSTLVESLRLRLEQLSTDHKNLKEQHATLRLVKRNETDKLYQTTALLNEKEKELEMFKRQYANIQFELDEIKLAQQLPQLKDENNTSFSTSSVQEILTIKEAENTKENIETVVLKEKNISIPTKRDVAHEELDFTVAAKEKDKKNEHNTEYVGPILNKPPPVTLTAGKPRKVTVDRSKAQECNQQ